MRYRKKACRLVRTHVKLVAEEATLFCFFVPSRLGQANCKNMTAALKSTLLGSWQGETSAGPHGELLVGKVSAVNLKVASAAPVDSFMVMATGSL